jgi:transposase
MLDFKHESNKFSTQRGDPREATHSGKANPGGMDWNKDRRTVAGFGGPAAGMDKRFVWIKPHDSGALDSWSEPGGSPSLKSEGPSRPHDSANACCEAKVGEQHLEKSPQEFGLPRAAWDGPTLVIHLKENFGVKLKVRQAQKWLHRLGYSLKRASYVYLQARAEDSRRFQKNLKKTARSQAQ